MKRNPDQSLFRSYSHLAKLAILAFALCFHLNAAYLKGGPSIVRLAVVVDPAESGLLDQLLPTFEKEIGYQVEVHAGMGRFVFELARSGGADLVVIHYGYPEVEQFVLEGLGLWPRTAFANQSAILGPSNDPAQIRGLSDAARAFGRIAESKSLFLVNNLEVVKRIENMLWVGSGSPKKEGWYKDLGLAGQQAVEAADLAHAYTIWGLDPFIRLEEAQTLDTQALVTNDPLLQRMMVSIIVNPKRVPGVNFEGATALQDYLLRPDTQMLLIRAFRDPNHEEQLWWPSSLHN